MEFCDFLTNLLACFSCSRDPDSKEPSKGSLNVENVPILSDPYTTSDLPSKVDGPS